MNYELSNESEAQGSREGHAVKQLVRALGQLLCTGC